MNWKPGDMAILKSVEGLPELLPEVEGMMCENAIPKPPQLGINCWGVDVVNGLRGYVYEPCLFPIEDPDQHAEPRETEIDKPCTA